MKRCEVTRQLMNSDFLVSVGCVPKRVNACLGWDGGTAKRTHPTH